MGDSNAVDFQMPSFRFVSSSVW